MSLLRNSLVSIDTGRLPRFHRWDCGRFQPDWSFGWKTGKDKDLICLKSHIDIELKEPTLSLLLSPICSNRLLALCAFVMKALLLRIDRNSKRCLEG
jgi:hypothetical protein